MILLDRMETLYGFYDKDNKKTDNSDAVQLDKMTPEQMDKFITDND